MQKRNLAFCPELVGHYSMLRFARTRGRQHRSGYDPQRRDDQPGACPNLATVAREVIAGQVDCSQPSWRQVLQQRIMDDKDRDDYKGESDE
jgi:hypothetical protein